MNRLLCCLFCMACLTSECAAQFRYHSSPEGAHPLMKDQANEELPSLLITDSGAVVDSPQHWHDERRPEIVGHWKNILGKLQPSESDAEWFGDVTAVVEVSRQKKTGYTRVELQIPIEKDFLQSHLLLIPDDAVPGTCPAVIAWTSTGPDFRQPEIWWGEWLAQRGFVVLTGWSHIRHYRNGSSFRNQVNQIGYERFGRWLPMGKMVHDVHREIEFLRSVPEVDAERIGFMGFSLSAKSALYVAAFVEDVKATVSIDPHLAIYGASNYLDPWYLDARRRFSDIKTPGYPDPKLRDTVWSLLDADPSRPGFEHNHHELLALAAPRAMMVIGCSTDKLSAVHSDDQQSASYINRAQEVFKLLNVPRQLQYVDLTCGHKADDPQVAAAWQKFLMQQLMGDR